MFGSDSTIYHCVTEGNTKSQSFLLYGNHEQHLFSFPSPCLHLWELKYPKPAQNDVVRWCVCNI